MNLMKLSNLTLIIFITFGILGIIEMLESDRDFSKLDRLDELIPAPVIINNTIDNTKTIVLPSVSEERISVTENKIKELENQSAKNNAYKVIGECVLVYEENNETVCLGVRK